MTIKQMPKLLQMKQAQQYMNLIQAYLEAWTKMHMLMLWKKIYNYLNNGGRNGESMWITLHKNQ